MDGDDSRLENDQDYRLVVSLLQTMVSTVRRRVALHQVKTTADFIMVMEALRLCGVSMAEAGNNLGVPPATVHNWQNGQSLPLPQEYQGYAELATKLIVTHLIHFAGRKWSLLTPVPQ